VTPSVSVAVTVTVQVPSLLPEPEIVPFGAILMPGGSPVAVNVRACDALESTACMANDTVAPFGLL